MCSNRPLKPSITKHVLRIVMGLAFVAVLISFQSQGIPPGRLKKASSHTIKPIDLPAAPKQDQPFP